MPNSENSKTEVPTQSLKIAQTTTKPPDQIQAQTLASAPTSQQPPKGKFLKKVLIIPAALLVIAGLVIFGLYWSNIQNIKERDARRKSDFVIIQQALEIYRQDTLNAQYYPSAITANTLEKRAYLAKFPTDPENSSPYIYNYQGLPKGCAATGACTGYVLTACLENKNDKGEKTTSPVAPCTTRSYQISKP